MSRRIDHYDDGDPHLSYTARSSKRGRFSRARATAGSREPLYKKRRQSFGGIKQRRNKHWAW